MKKEMEVSFFKVERNLAIVFPHVAYALLNPSAWQKLILYL